MSTETVLAEAPSWTVGFSLHDLHAAKHSVRTTRLCEVIILVTKSVCQGEKMGTKDLFGACIEWRVLPDNIGITTSPNAGEEWELSIYTFSGQNSHGGRQLSWKDKSHAYFSITTSSFSVNKHGSPNLLDWLNPKPNIHFPFAISRRKEFHFG